MGESGQDARRFRMVAGGTIFYLLVAFLVLALARWWPGRMGFVMFPSGGASWTLSLMSGAAVGLVVVAVSWLLATRTQSGRRLSKTLADAAGAIKTFDAILLAVMAGVSEELFFRGALWALVDSFLGQWSALAVTSLLFGAVHGAFRKGYILWSGFALAAGVLCGILLMVTGNLLASVVMHIVIDAVNLPFLIRRFGDAGGSPPRQ